MSTACRSLFEMGRRAYGQRLDEINDRMGELDSSDSDVEDEMEELVEEAELIGFAMGWMEPQDTRMGHRITSLDVFGDQECYELFKFKKDELQTMHDMLRIPDIVRVNGSKYTKLEAMLCILGRYASAAQLSRMTPTFKLHAKRLSELKLHTGKVLYEAHCRDLLTSIEPWVDSFPYFAECIGRKGGVIATSLNLIAFQDGHFHEVCAQRIKLK